MKVDPATARVHSEKDWAITQHLSDAGGLTQFGAYRETLLPGTQSSHRHWHSAEDEMLLVLDGTATVIDDDGPHEVTAGDAICWRHGDPNAHQVKNLSDRDVTYIIMGTRVAEDICTYPDSGRRLVNSMTHWQLLEASGDVVREGVLPPNLLNLPHIWGDEFDPAKPTPHFFPADTAEWRDDPDTAHPILGTGPGHYRYRLISNLGGISQFGAFIEELPPGSSSGRRHWHETEDEMIYLLSGEVVLVEDQETPLVAGDTACWPAGSAMGHRLDNRSDGPARYLVIGTRKAQDRIHYIDHDLITEKDGPARRYFHRDGTPYDQGKRT